MARFFGGGFASGALASVALYSIYAYVVQPERTAKEEISAPPKLKERNDLLKFGIPDRGPEVRFYSNYASSYDQSKKIPLWVAEHITEADLKGSANRKHCNFVEDPNIQVPFASQNSDYKRSGWSRGHMAPAADFKHSQAAMGESFYLSNIVPQDINNNSDFWNRLEIYCRNLAKKYSGVWVTTGPLILPTLEEDGKRYVKYQVIGKNNVAVPTHLYKLITVALPQGGEKDASEGGTSEDEAIAVGAFIVPNQDIPKSHQLRDYQVPLENLTESSGLRFLTGLRGRARVRDLCEVDTCRLMSQQQMQLYIIGRRLESAATLHRLEESWNELEKRKLQPDDYLREAYQRKKEELGGKEARQASKSGL